MPFIIAVCPLSQLCIGIFSRLDRGVLDVMLVYSLLTLWIFVSSYNRHIVGMETRSDIWKCSGPDGESQSWSQSWFGVGLGQRKSVPFFYL